MHRLTSQWTFKEKFMHNANMNPPWLVSFGVLLVMATLIHFLFAGVIRPNAELALAASGTAGMSSLSVIFKDYEQQICVTLMLFCLFLMGYKLWKLLGEEGIYAYDYLEDFDKSEPLDIKAALTSLQASDYAHTPAMTTWINCLTRFHHTSNVQHAAEAISASIDTLAMQLESGNNMIKYIIWAIPSIGFVGTVRGIGQALTQADQALAGDISGMTASLGVAFNSTLVALLISLLLMLVLHVLHNRQDRMLLRTQASCENNLLSHLHN
jgi:biopolymer transport protein ExbB/TolQ